MTAVSEAMPVYAPEMDAEAFVSVPERLQQLAAAQPDKPAVYDETGMLTWRQFVDNVNRVANRLRAAGLQRGETVAGLSENSARYLTLFMGTLTAGGCMVPLSGMAAGDTLALMVNDCDARFLFVSAKHRDLIEPLLDGLDGAWMYFVHSLVGPAAPEVSATCSYGGPQTAAVRTGTTWATQFHPEKSAKAGLALLRNFVGLAARAKAGA